MILAEGRLQQEITNHGDARSIAMRHSYGAGTITTMYGHGEGTITMRYCNKR